MPDEPEQRLTAWFQCRICEEMYDHDEDAAMCCDPVRDVFICSECEEDFNSLEEAARHIHLNHVVQSGLPSLGEWATKIEVEREIECQTG